jgi:hypothetical protein
MTHKKNVKYSLSVSLQNSLPTPASEPELYLGDRVHYYSHSSLLFAFILSHVTLNFMSLARIHFSALLMLGFAVSLALANGMWEKVIMKPIPSLANNRNNIFLLFPFVVVMIS